MFENMILVLAPDSFKESMTSIEVCDAMEKGIRKANPNTICIKVPMADGGEGTMRALVSATEGEILTTEVRGPLGNNIKAEYGILGNKKTAVIEMASASGLQLVPKNNRNPLSTTTYGTGQLIKQCLDRQVDKIVIGIGGSATNDGGVGMMQALGAKMLDENGEQLSFGGGQLNRLRCIDLEYLDHRIKNVIIDVACDVDNPLLGPLGASYVYGPQKGATISMIETLEKNLSHYNDIIKRDFNIDVSELPGSGAAGGLGASLIAFLNGELKKGVDLVVEYTKLEDKIKNAQMVWTGEGRIDDQTLFGKTPFGVCRIAKKYNIPVIALAGQVGSNLEELYSNGFDAVFSICQGVSTIEEAIKNSKINVEKTSENIMRLYGIQM